MACLIIVGVIGWGGYSVQTHLVRLRQAHLALSNPTPQHTPNWEAKSDRLAVVKAVASAAPEMPASYTLASLETGAVTLEKPSPVPEAAAPVETPVASQPPRVAPPPRPVDKPKPKQSAALLDDAGIAGIKHRLRLTADQEGYWPAVEAALRDIARHHLLQSRSKRNSLSPAQIDVNSPEVQRLTWAAMPLLMRMREDQKREVRTLARVMGLDAVASQI
ncbi:MAG: hypothetical protein AB7K04_01090 [Pseudorhodoplanes sp.]